MATGKALKKSDTPISIAAMLALHFAAEDKALGYRSGTKTRKMLSYYLVMRQKYTGIILEAAALNGTIQGYRIQVDDLVNKAKQGMADIEDVKRAETLRVLSDKAVKRLESLEKVMAG